MITKQIDGNNEGCAGKFFIVEVKPDEVASAKTQTMSPDKKKVKIGWTTDEDDVMKELWVARESLTLSELAGLIREHGSVYFPQVSDVEVKGYNLNITTMMPALMIGHSGSRIKLLLQALKPTDDNKAYRIQVVDQKTKEVRRHVAKAILSLRSQGIRPVKDAEPGQAFTVTTKNQAIKIALEYPMADKNAVIRALNQGRPKKTHVADYGDRVTI
jgi:hypothetical protein